MRVAGERVSNGDVQAIPMVTGDYASYDNVSQKLSLYPNAGDFGVMIYAAYSVVASLTGAAIMGTTAALPANWPTPH
jgi:hypothetical protein